MKKALLLALIAGALGCEKKQDVELRDYGGPRPAHSAPPSPVSDRPLRYTVSSESSLEFTVPARTAAPSGRIAALRGSLELHPMQLRSTRATIVFDLTTLFIEQQAGGDADEYTSRARNWLGLGAQRPPEALALSREAKFELDHVDALSASAAHQGSRSKRPLDDERGDGSEPESRLVEASAVGALTLGGRRIERSIPVVAEFQYESPALSGIPPHKIIIETKQPVAVSLADHDIEPRDPRGTVLSAELPLLGTVVGRTARVKVRLILERHAEAGPSLD